MQSVSVRQMASFGLLLPLLSWPQQIEPAAAEQSDVSSQCMRTDEHPVAWAHFPIPKQHESPTAQAAVPHTIPGSPTQWTMMPLTSVLPTVPMPFATLQLCGIGWVRTV